MNNSRIIPDVRAAFGAPMGRPSFNVSESLEGLTARVVTIDGQGYDLGGAYWGIGAPVIVAFKDDLSTVSFWREASDVVDFSPYITGDINPEDIDPAAMHPVLFGFIELAVAFDSQMHTGVSDDASVLDVHHDTLVRAAEICGHFTRKASESISAAIQKDVYSEIQLGRDLYFTRVGSGIDFTDRENLDPDVARALSEHAGSSSFDVDFINISGADVSEDVFEI